MTTFVEAALALEAGKKITRQDWVGSIYFKIFNNAVYAFQQRVIRFDYNESIMVSNDWYIPGHEKTYHFYEIVDHLKKGEPVYLSKDSEKYIFVDQSGEDLLQYIEEPLTYPPRFYDFIANDWVILDD